VKTLCRGTSAIEVLMVVALVALLNLLGAQHYRAQLERVSADWRAAVHAPDAPTGCQVTEAGADEPLCLRVPLDSPAGGVGH